jgi:PAS domain S-box-containing protein
MTERARVLVVDDEVGPRESLRMILKPWYEVATADTAETAVDAVRTFRPDVVFTDIRMPQVSGIELLQRIKEIDRTIAVVMITAYASLDTVKNALTHGAFEYLIKPFGRHDVEETARRALARRQQELGTRSEVAALVEQMRELAARTRERAEADARREQAEQSLRITQLSILRAVSHGILGQLDLSQLVSTVTRQLRHALGYDEVRVELGPTAAESSSTDESSAVCVIRDEAGPVGCLVVSNVRGRPIDPRERELLEMLADYLAVAIRNSRLYGEVADTKRSLELVIRSAGEAIIPVDREERVADWNPAAERIFGLAAAEAIGTPLSALLPGKVYGAARHALSPAQPVQVFDVTTRRGDRRLELSVTLSALAGGEGGEGLLAIVRDITAQRALEAQVLRAEKLTALGQLAGGIAHDFNNLLQAILGYAQVMARSPGDVEIVRQGLGVIEAAATHGAEAVRRIQKFARLRPEDPPVPVDLNQVIEDAVTITRPRWEERTLKGGVPLRLDLALTPALPPVMGRPAELGEVVTNLILNAIDAMPHGGTLTISTAAGPSAQVIVNVRDTGLGMTDAVRRRIFDPFFTTKPEEGTGLGLSMSHAIVTRHGGDVQVDSEPGRGTAFTITLPVGEASRPAVASEPHRAPARRARILLVDNEPHVLDILGEMLRDAGHEVVPVRSGAEAVAVFARDRFDTVLTNIGMTGMNGWEVLEAIRAHDARVPVLFVTGWGLHDEERERCRKWGVRVVLYKPLRAAELHEALQSALASPDNDATGR